MKIKNYILILFLLVEIDAAGQLEEYNWQVAKDTLIPKDLHNYTLIVETYNYTDFLELNSTECYKQTDNKRIRKKYIEYDKVKLSYLHNYKFEYIYSSNENVDTFDINTFRYVLRKKMKILTPIEYLPSGECNGWVASNGFYIYDRKYNLYYPFIAAMKLKKLDIGIALNK
jgi:hypothetical protein